MTMSILSDYERDAFAESFNIGIGRAASSLSEMIGQEISLTVPTVTVLKKQDAISEMAENQSKRVRGVRENFTGPFSGCALLLFPEDRSMALVRLLLQDDIDMDFLTEMEEEALIEVGNIILNACLSSIADIVGSEIHNQLPVLVNGDLNEIILGDTRSGSDDLVMNLRVEFSVDSIDIKGHIALVMDLDSLDKFRQRVALYFGYDAA